MPILQQLVIFAACLFAVAGQGACGEPRVALDGGNEPLTVDCAVSSLCLDATFEAWSECTAEDTCALKGIQTRTVTFSVRESGECQSRKAVETRTCERSTSGHPCDDGDARTGDDHCEDGVCRGHALHPEPSSPEPPGLTTCRNAGASCSTGNPCEVGKIRCVDGRSQCVAVGLADADTVCRAASGPCDLAEFCTGMSAECPADRLSSAESVCRPAAGPCDRAEACTGTGPDCPADAFFAADIVCRNAASECDSTETCTGKSALCPDDDAGCDANEYCLIDACWPDPSIDVQGNAGDACSDLASAREGGDALLRIVFHGRPHAQFRYLKKHASCISAFFTEQPDVVCDEGTVGQFDAGGTCTWTMRGEPAGAECPSSIAGRWEVYIESDGRYSNRDFINVYNSSSGCADNPRACTAAAHYCPADGPCGDSTCAAGDQSEPVLPGMPGHGRAATAIEFQEKTK